jgi:hypothetical protein
MKLNKKDYILMTGIMGVEIENEVMDVNVPDEFWQYVKPAIGWAIYENDPSIKKMKKQVFVAAETAGPMF